jgi:hypothetical protein
VKNDRRALIAIAATVLLMIWELYNCSSTRALFGDFRAFYCAGAAVAHGANPYAASAIYACERAPMPLGLAQAPPGVAVPAPFPGYALLAFVPFGVLPYLPASALWLAMLAATIFLSAWILTLLLDRPFEATLATLAVGFAVVSLPYGELGSVIVVALLWLALALRRAAWTWAAVVAGVDRRFPFRAEDARASDRACLRFACTRHALRRTVGGDFVRTRRAPGTRAIGDRQHRTIRHDMDSAWPARER